MKVNEKGALKQPKQKLEPNVEPKPKSYAVPPPVRREVGVDELKALLRQALVCVEEYGDMRGGDKKWPSLHTRIRAAIENRTLVEFRGGWWCDHGSELQQEPCRYCTQSPNDIDLWIAA